MNPEQALKIIDGIEEVRGNLPEDGLLVEEALIDVKDASKKQVPKEPIWSYEYAEWFREKMKAAGKGLMADTKTYCCPRCKYSLVISAFVKAAKNKVYGDKYCKNCGQRISWENIPEGGTMEKANDR